MFSFKRSIIALVGVFVIVGALATLMPLVIRGQGGDNPFDRDTRRSFYVTKTFHNGSQAPSACATGYHMASLWEIFDTSNLRYDTELGFTSADSSFGPPSSAAASGWIRPGGGTSGGGTGIAGRSNCLAWMSASNMDNGTLVFLPWASWDDLNVTVISPWIASTNTCESSQRVWCMQD